MFKPILSFENLSVSYQNKQIFEDLSGKVLNQDKIGLIGKNGSGKSTLAKVLSQDQNYNVFGNLSLLCSVKYVSQLQIDFDNDQLVYEYISSKYDSWWEVIEFTENVFDLSLDETQYYRHLSGGELLKLEISIAASSESDLIIFDEPTNHLDSTSIDQLKIYLEESNKAYIVISHDIDFLNSVTETTWEINSGKLNTYGGNYNFYKEQKENLLNAQKLKYETVKKKLKKEKEAIVKEKVKYQKKQAKIKQMGKADDRSMPKSVRHQIKRQLQKNEGKAKLRMDKSVEELETSLEKLKINKPKKVRLGIPQSIKEKGLIIKITDGKLSINDRVLIADINLSIYAQDKIALLGDNGVGKSTLIKEFLVNNSQKLKGSLKVDPSANIKILSQKYENIDLSKSVKENLSDSNRNLKEEDIRKLLANIGFYSEEQINRKATSLSGGEIAKLSFTIATNSDVDLLILDEPTNNLDIETKESIISAINSYEGAFVIISHDKNLMKNLEIDRSIEIRDRKLIELNSN